MLLKGYKKEIFKPKCNPHFESLHCIAYLDNDISEVIPYLNSVLGGTSYQKNPPSVMFQVHGRLIAVHSQEIAINALKDEAEAEKILQWLKREINETWEKRHDLEPSEDIAEKPQLLEILKRLPKTNCGKCGHPTCMVFSTMVIQGIKRPEECPELIDDERIRLDKYLGQFHFIDM